MKIFGLSRGSQAIQWIRSLHLKDIARALYRYIPWKRNIFHLLRALYSPSAYLSQHLWFYGAFLVPMADTSFVMVNHNSKLETQLFWNGIDGYEEKESLRLWAGLCAEAEVVFDIGANTGLFSLIAQTRNPKASVYAFEPIQRIAAKFQDNCLRNQYTIQVHPIAVSNSDGKAVIYDLPLQHHYVGSLEREETAHHFAGSESGLISREVQTITLATFIRQERIARVDLMKIDVEGHEMQVLEGMGGYLRGMQPTILIEIKSTEHANRIEEMMHGCDYHFYDIDEKTPPRRIPRLRASSFRNLLICSPNVAARLGLSASATGNQQP